MPRFIPLKTDTKWVRLEVTAADWKREKPEELTRLMEQLFVIRRFEDKILKLQGEGLVHGPAHTSQGQEGGAVGCMSALTDQDMISGSHRMHHQFLAKVLNYAMPRGYNPCSQSFPRAMQDMLYRTMAEIMGLTPGFGGGRGGSMHLRLEEAGVLGASAIVAGSAPQASGYALAAKLRSTGNISVNFVGDGGVQNGAVYEAMNLSAALDLPVIFFIENNGYAVSTKISESTRETRLSARGLGLAIPAVVVDGNNPLAVRKAFQWAREKIHKEGGPIIVESKTYRHFHHSGSMVGSAFGYRTKDEEKEWSKRDPVIHFPMKLIDFGVVTPEQVNKIDQRSHEIVDAAAASLTENEPNTNQRRIIPSLWPDPAQVDYGMRGDLSEMNGVRYREVEDFSQGQLKEVTYVQAVAKVMLRNMERNQNVIVLGEDVHRMHGGHSGATKGIDERFPERLIGTPISEAGFVGMGLGAALAGIRPVIELMYPDFCWVAADQLFNHVGKMRHMFGGDFPVPIVVRSRVAPADGYGSQHSMDPSGVYALFPGWRIVAPSTPYDYIGLMNSAIKSDDPVLIVEGGDLYATKGLIPKDDLDYFIPFGSAKVVRRGNACTVLAHLSMVSVCVDAANQSGIDAEVIDLRTVDPLGLDWDTIEESLKRTNRIMIVEQRTRGTSLGARIVQEIQSRFFDWLDHEVLHVCGTDSPPVVSKVLEKASIASFDDVVAGMKALTDNIR